MAIYSTRKLVEELKAVLEANSDITKVSVEALTPISAETVDSAVYISVEEIAMEQKRLNKTSSAYDRHLLVNLYCNYDSSADPLNVYDFIDSVERCVLEDNDLWLSIVDRDLLAIDFDNQASGAKRSITMLFDISYRLACS